MHEKTLITKNDNIRATTQKSGAFAKQPHKGPNSCNSCGICSRLRSPHISSKQASGVISEAKASGRETCAVSFMQKYYGNNLAASALGPAVQKKCSCGGGCSRCNGEEEAERVSMNIMNPAVSRKASINFKPSSSENNQDLISDITSGKGTGHGLDSSSRSFMEQRIGYDFNNVRVHTDSYAAQTSRALNAEAFTIGRDVFFNTGRYNPSTTEGKQLLSHELTHVIQQGEAPAIQFRTERGNGYRVDDAEDCRGNWQQIGTAVGEARRMVTAASAAVQPETRRAERIRNALQTHFHISQPACVIGI